jgi:nitrilase
MSTLKIAVVQAAPVPLDFDGSIAKATALSARAVADGAKVIAFGETFIGGYPLWLDEAPGAAQWEHPGTRSLHRVMLERAIVPGDPRLAPLQELADSRDAIISIGAHERVRNSLYNSQLTFRPGQAPLTHRKLVPTHGERLIWARGDGSTLQVHQAAYGNVGNLICWEHWMPLARAAMHNQGEVVHVAAWPTVREIYAIASRHYAFEGRCFVLAAGLVQNRDDFEQGLRGIGDGGAAAELIATMPSGQLNKGQSMIIGPDGGVIAHAGEGEETLIAEVDLAEIGAALTSLDVDGHYSRPDIFELQVNTAQQPGVRWARNEK